MKTFYHISIALVLLFTLGNAQNPSGYHLTKKILIGGEGGWDYLTVDSKAHRLYVSHSTQVEVLNTDSNSVVGKVLKTEGIHGIAIVSDAGHGFSSNGRPSTVSMFDLKTLNVISEIPVGKKPDTIIYDPASRNVFVFNGESEDVSVIDPVAGKVVATLPLGGGPEFAAADGQGHIYVNIENKSEIVAFDSKTPKIISRWPLAPGEEPSGLAMDIQHRRLFSVCRNQKMIVLDADNGKVIAALTIGKGVDGCAFDPGTGLAFSSNGEGTLTVVREDSPNSFSVLEDVPTQRGARTIALDPATHTIYLPTAEFGPAPAPTPEHPRPRPSILPNTFVILKLQK